MTLRLRSIVLMLLAGVLSWQAPQAAAEVRRCVTPSGQAVFTDRTCADVGGTERVPRATADGQTRMYRGGCARNLQDLVFEITTAIDARDANRLAGVYHWAGMSGTAGYQVWSRLDTIARRPLVDIVPVMPSAPAATSLVPAPPNPSATPAPPPLTGAPAAPAAPAASAASAASAAAAPILPPPDPQLYPQTSVRRTPVALRIEQTLGGSATPSRTVFGLIRHFGCWWVRL